MEVKSDAEKNNIAYEPGTMNQSKVEVVKQEMARVNSDVLGISKLKWTRQVNLTQMTILSTTVGKNALEEKE